MNRISKQAYNELLGDVRDLARAVWNNSLCGKQIALADFDADAFHFPTARNGEDDEPSQNGEQDQESEQDQDERGNSCRRTENLFHAPTMLAMKNRFQLDFQDKKPMCDMMTDFNNRFLFRDADQRIGLILLVVSVYDALFNELYSLEPSRLGPDSLTLIFKGGSVVRFAALEMLKNLDRAQQARLREEFLRVFKLSDLDFEIFSQANLLTVEEYNKINVASFCALLRLQRTLHANRSVFFHWFQLADKEARRVRKKMERKIAAFLKCLRGDHPLRGASVSRITERCLLGASCVRSSFARIGAGGEKLVVIDANKLMRRLRLPEQPEDQDSLFYASFNAGVFNEEQKLGFHLNRIKYNYIAEIRLPVREGEGSRVVQLSLPGEILDVSHAFEIDRKKLHCVKPFSQNEYFQTWTLLEKAENPELAPTGQRAKVRSLSVGGMIDDISIILFADTELRPWTNEKYEKRLARLVILCFLQAVSEGDDPERALKRVRAKRHPLQKQLAAVRSSVRRSLAEGSEDGEEERAALAEFEDRVRTIFKTLQAAIRAKGERNSFSKVTLDVQDSSLYV